MRAKPSGPGAEVLVMSDVLGRIRSGASVEARKPHSALSSHGPDEEERSPP
jgi:hypothetical protein